MNSTAGPLVDLSSKDFCVILPEGDGRMLEALRAKCDLLGILPMDSDARSVYHFYYQEADKLPAVSEIELKDWINSHGTSAFIEDEESTAYKNLERLLLSKQTSNVILALTMINTVYRPAPKYFSLLLAAHHYPDQEVVEMAKMIVKQYVKESNSFGRRVLNTVSNYLHDASHPYYKYFDLNYYQYWIWLLLGHDGLGTENKSLFISSKNIDLLMEKNIFDQVLPEIVQLGVPLEDGAKLECTYDIINKITTLYSMDVFSDHPYHIQDWERGYINRWHLSLKNFVLPEYPTKDFIYDNVRTLALVSDKEIILNDVFFPNVTQLYLGGPKIHTINISQIDKALTKIEIKLSEEEILPDCIYDCENVTEMWIRRTTIKNISPKASQLLSLKKLELRKCKFLEFPIEFFLAPELEEISGLPVAPNNNYRIDKYNLDSKVHSIVFDKEYLNEFPYGLSVLKQLKYMSIKSSHINEIDSRMEGFLSLANLSFSSDELDHLPDSLMLLPKIERLTLKLKKELTISFGFINFVFEKGLHLQLYACIICDLPPIPNDYKIPNQENKRPMILMRSLNLPASTISNYKEVFGNKIRFQ